MQPARKAAEESVNHLIPRLPLTTPFVDEPVLFQIQRYLDRHEFFRPWRGNPRLFTLLRMLQCEERVLKRFLSADVSDICLPLDEIAFSGLGVELDWDSFRLTQHYILSNPKYLSRSELDSTGLRVHRHLDNGEDYFESRGPLGEGATASVFKVQHTSWDNVQDGKFYACKRSTRGTWRQQKERIRLFVQELQILRRLSHPHTVRLVASYTDMKYFALVLHPMADESLKDMLSNVLIPLQAADSARLCRWFGCLASALTYLHEQCIRHKDIKPSNILLSSGTVYLCDFGISNDWTGSNPTTEGPSYLTRGYCSPEVWRKLPRNDASDVWSMGRVFCDMYTVLANRPLDDLMTCLGGNLLGVYDEGCLERLHNWLSSLILQDVPNGLLATIQHMVSLFNFSKHRNTHYV
jgi:serine/threonine protein kinase